MRINLTKKSGPDIKELLADIPRRMKNVATEVGRAVADATADEVKKRLAGRGGWLDIYYKAIIYRESAEGDHWAVAGLTETDSDLFEYPAETSLLVMTEYPENSASSLLANNQPWPIDIIPPLTTAYPGKAEVRMYDAGTVSTYREARLRNLPSIIDELNATEGAQVDTSIGAIVRVQRVFADIAFMARRLELGFNGYPRVPHWGPAAAKIASRGADLATTPTKIRLIEDAIKGKEPGKVAIMSASEASELARIRAASWS